MGFIAWISRYRWRLGECWRCGHRGIIGHEWSEYSGICRRCVNQVNVIIAIELAKQKARGERKP